jgi:hypothetical protein
MAGVFGASVKPGFNQTGGGYFLVISTVTPSQILTWSGGSGSGGAYAVGSFLPYSTLTPAANLNYSSVYSIGRVVRDMGKTIVSSGRTFRKFQGLAPTTGNSSPTFGVGGQLAGAGSPVAQTGYFTAYLEVAREGTFGDTASTNLPGVPQLVRYA